MANLSESSSRAPLEGLQGREVELSWLEAELDEVRRGGRGRVAVLQGRAGVGKSWLVRRFLSRVAADGVATLETEAQRGPGAAWRGAAPLLRQALEAVAQGGTERTRVAALRSSLAPVFAGEAQAASRSQLKASAAEVMALTWRQLAVVVLHDVDAMDEASLELLAGLAAPTLAPVGAPSVLWVVTSRERTLPAVLRQAQGSAAPRVLGLAGLGAEGVRAWLARGDVVQQVLEATGGSPAALGQWLDHAVPGHEEFTARSAHLGGPERAVLEVLAMATAPLDAGTVARALGAPLERVAASLDMLHGARLAWAVPRDGQQAWRFRREGEARVLLAQLDPGALTARALALAAALEAGGAGVAAAEVALVYAAPAAWPTVERVVVGLQHRGAFEDAAALLRRVQVPEASRAAWAQAQAVAAEPMGQWRTVARRRLQAARLTGGDRAGELARAARALLKLGRVGWAARVAHEAGGAPEARVLAAELALSRGDARGAVAACLALGAVAAEHGLDGALQNTHGKALLLLGRHEEAEAVFLAAGQVARARGDEAGAALARLNEGVAAYKRGDREKAAEAWASTPAGHQLAWAQARANLGSLEAERGQADAAVGQLGQALQAFVASGSRREAGLAASNLARVCLQLGDVERAAELSAWCLELALGLGERYLEASARLNLGGAALERRAWGDAQAAFEAAHGLFAQVGHGGYAALALALLGRAHLEAGSLASAQAVLARPELLAGEAALPTAALEGALARGELAVALGDLATAGRAVARAREVALEHGELEGPWRAAALSARVRRAAGDEAGARAELERAAARLDELSQSVPAARRLQYLSLPMRAALLAAVAPARAAAVGVAAPALELPHGLIGASPALHRVTKQLEAVGRSQATVLVRGESGTGKELIAEALHRASPRRHLPLVKVNCAAMVEELLLSELFGHEKGAFTGAVKERKGRFELADGGTIFLDEIGDISPRAQVALLRVLQEREFERVGGTRTLQVDVRVVCATNRDLEALIAQGLFRADLYYRLKGVMLELPALRERKEDLPRLCTHFLSQAARKAGTAPRTLSPQALELLARHDWPGNVRELENVVSSGLIFAEGPVIGPEAFFHVEELQVLATGVARERPQAAAPGVRPVREVAPVAAVAPAMEAALADPTQPIDYYELARQRGISLKDLRHEVEMQCIRRALVDAQGNISEAARLLGVKRSRLSQIVNAEASLKEVAHGL